MNYRMAASRFKQIREELGYTQQQFAEILDVGKSTIDIERGKTKLPAHVLFLLEQKYNVNSSWIFGESNRKFKKPSDVAPKTIILNPDDHDRENISMVTAKAAAGYADNLDNDLYYRELPSFNLPFPQFSQGSYRGFEVQGDSMTGIFEEGDWVIGKAVSSASEVHDKNHYVVVMESGILVKKVLKTENSHTYILHSHNPEYDPLTIRTDEILEMWHVVAKLDLELN